MWARYALFSCNKAGKRSSTHPTFGGIEGMTYQAGTPEQWAEICKEAQRQCHEMNNVKSCEECQTLRRSLLGVHLTNEMEEEK